MPKRRRLKIFKKEPITITEEQFVKAAAKATEKVFNETKDLEIILPMGIMTSFIARELFHAGEEQTDGNVEA